MTHKQLILLAKNTALAFAAGFTTSLAAFFAFTESTDLPGLKAAGLAAAYAGARAATGFLKSKFGSKPFSVDTA